jgi:long-chain acyl-CoA synthetase
MIRFSFAALLAAFAITAGAADVSGVHVEDHAKIGTAELVLNGAGLRSKLFFKVYVIGVYAPKKTSNAAELIDSREPRRVAMHLLRDLDADSLINGLKDGLRQNHNDAELAALKADIDRLETIMRAIGAAKPGDLIALDFNAEGTAISFNGQARGSIPGTAFCRALLKIWLGSKPIDDKLKQALLGA